MTSSEMAKKANENRRKKLGKKGYSDYMRKLSETAVKARVDKSKKTNKHAHLTHACG